MSEQPSNGAHFSDVTDGTSSKERGGAIQERFDALGYGYRKFEELTGVGRKTLHRAFEGKSTDTTYTAIEARLDRLEARKEGRPVALPQGVQEVDQPAQGMVRIRLEGVFGADVAIAEAPVDNPDALAAALDILMRRLKSEAKGDDTES